MTNQTVRMVQGKLAWYISAGIVISATLYIVYIYPGGKQQDDRMLPILAPHTDRDPADKWRPFLPQRLRYTNQTDRDLIQQIRNNWIQPPDTLPLNVSRPSKTYFAEDRQDEYISRMFPNKTDGFYVECGASNGESNSVTLYFERQMGWKGLLIEADPNNFASVIQTHRNAFMLNACLSPITKSAALNFTIIVDHPNLSRLEYLYEKSEQYIHRRIGKVTRQHQIIQCFPAYSILAALNRHVDFFSLDIEAAEFDVLRTIPFDKIDVDVFLIETCTKCGRVKAIQSLMEPYGYRMTMIPGNNHDIVMSRI